MFFHPLGAVVRLHVHVAPQALLVAPGGPVILSLGVPSPAPAPVCMRGCPMLYPLGSAGLSSLLGLGGVRGGGWVLGRTGIRLQSHLPPASAERLSEQRLASLREGHTGVEKRGLGGGEGEWSFQRGPRRSETSSSAPANPALSTDSGTTCTRNSQPCRFGQELF